MNCGPDQPWDVWRAAVNLSAIDDAIRRLYRRVDQAVTARGPQCWASGRCCRFDRFRGGHRLYVTGLEIAWVLSRQSEEVRGLAKGADLRGPCPFQSGHLCGIHADRPLGCRLFFCQRGSDVWQHELYEQFLGDLRRLHDAHGLPYAYMEWRAGLREAVAALWPAT